MRNRLYTKRLFKRFRWCSTKRWFIPGPGGNTLPYGFGAEEGDVKGLDELCDILNTAINVSSHPLA